MDKKQFEEGLAKFKESKSKDNYLLISFGYQTNIILPYKEGMVFVETLNKAEVLKDRYNEIPNLAPFTESDLSITVMSADVYRQYKTAELMRIPFSEIQEAEKAYKQGTLQ